MVKPNNVANLNQIFILLLVINRMSKPSHFQREYKRKRSLTSKQELLAIQGRLAWS